MEVSGIGVMYITSSFDWCLDRVFWRTFALLQIWALTGASRRRWWRWPPSGLQIQSWPSILISRSNPGSRFLWLLIIVSVTREQKPTMSARFWSVWSTTSINEAWSDAPCFFEFSIFWFNFFYSHYFQKFIFSSF